MPSDNDSHRVEHMPLLILILVFQQGLELLAAVSKPASIRTLLHCGCFYFASGPGTAATAVSSV